MVCYSYVLVCHPYVTRIYTYVIRMLLVCTRNVTIGLDVKTSFASRAVSHLIR